MKIKCVCLMCVFLLLALFTSCSKNISVKMRSLKTDEKLTYLKQDDPIDPNKIELIISAEGKQKTEVFKYSGYGFLIMPENQSKEGEWLTFLVTTQKGDGKVSSIVELWYVDGISGSTKKIYSSRNLIYVIDTEAKMICVYDYAKSIPIPTIDIYKFPGMEFIKTVQVPELNGKGTSPDSITFSDNKFVIKLSNDGPDYKTIEIPIQ